MRRYRDDETPELGGIDPLVLGLALFSCLLVLVACATDQAGAPAPKLDVVAKVQCLPAKTYTPAEQTAAAGELTAYCPAHPGSVVCQMIVDYGQMRAANRACQGATP